MPGIDPHLGQGYNSAVLPPADRITSSSNPRFREWKTYLEHPETAPWLPVEGWKQVLELAARRTVRLLLLSEAPVSEPAAGMVRRCDQVVQLPARLLEKLSRVRTSQGVVAFFEKPRWTWEALGPCVIYLDRLQDPGNLGTILRSAAAFNFSLVTSPGTVACFNAKVVRASAGYLYQVPFLESATTAELTRRGYRWWLAAAAGDVDISSWNGEVPLALLVGREGGGIRAELPSGCGTIRIPTQREVDSLNAAVAASVLMCEAYRRGWTSGRSPGRAR